jgi:hypothetical protein
MVFVDVTVLDEAIRAKEEADEEETTKALVVAIPSMLLASHHHEQYKQYLRSIRFIKELQLSRIIIVYCLSRIIAFIALLHKKHKELQ